MFGMCFNLFSFIEWCIRGYLGISIFLEVIEVLGCLGV